jgi:SAM-dependent methyltransferase
LCDCGGGCVVGADGDYGLPESGDLNYKVTTMSDIKLNLGCGDKIIDGYINVDVVQERSGRQPDIVCDIRKLQVFQDNYCDEILSVHVIEHFWRWEVEPILKEWMRVLKPGGKIILECPNLKSACEEFIKNPDLGSLPGPEGQRTMWVLYGDPRWQDPLMVHRWGYTPKSLAQVLYSCGFIDVKQEAAQFKLREPRDMRITGIKPKSTNSGFKIAGSSYGQVNLSINPTKLNK